MKHFKITFIHQRYFGQGFTRSIETAVNAVAAYAIIKNSRGWKNPPVAVWVTME